METYCPEVKHLSLTSVSWGLMTSVCLYFCLRPWWSAALKDTVWLWLTKSLWICHMCIHVWWDCCVRSFMTDAFKFSIFFFLHHLSVTSIRFNTLIAAIQAQPGTPSSPLARGWWSKSWLCWIKKRVCGQI